MGLWPTERSVLAFCYYFPIVRMKIKLFQMSFSGNPQHKDSRGFFAGGPASILCLVLELVQDAFVFVYI